MRGMFLTFCVICTLDGLLLSFKLVKKKYWSKNLELINVTRIRHVREDCWVNEVCTNVCSRLATHESLAVLRPNVQKSRDVGDLN